MDEPKKVDQFNSGNNDNPSTGGVMDIQSPKPATDTAPSLPESVAQSTGSENLVTPSTAPLSAPSDNDFKQSPVSEPIAETNKVSDNTDNSGVAAEAQSGTTSADASTPTDPNPMAIPAHAGQKSNGPVVAIVVAIVVALALGGLVIFTFSKTKDNSAKTNSSAGPAPVVSKPLASPADVDTTTQELEASLSKIDEDKDFSSEELSDKSLGL